MGSFVPNGNHAGAIDPILRPVAYTLDMVIGVALVVVIPSALSFFMALATWKLVFRSQPLRLGGSLLILAVSMSSACGLYGHGQAGPVVLLAFEHPSAWEPLGVQALVVGVVVTGLFVWWSHRRMRRQSATPST